MTRSAIFNRRNGIAPVEGDLTTEDPMKSDALVLIARDGSRYGLEELHRGKVTILVDRV